MRVKQEAEMAAAAATAKAEELARQEEEARRMQVRSSTPAALGYVCCRSQRSSPPLSLISLRFGVGWHRDPHGPALRVIALGAGEMAIGAPL